MSTQLNDAVLQGLIANYMHADQGVSEHRERIKVIEQQKPKPKQVYDSVAEWEQHLEAVQDYNHKVHLWTGERDKLLAAKELAEKSIISALPANTWFRSSWEDAEIWVGYQTSNWGGYNAAVCVSFTLPDRMLKHLVYD